jgi:glutamyl-tRNA synthetase
MTVVTRFAPSPTGFLHIGGARTALFNWLYARHHGGLFHLRIEDTDRARSTEAAVEAIIDGLSWMGLQWDGEVVSQFARAKRHIELANQLLEAGKAYRCYCTKEELAEMRETARSQGKPMRYDGRWRERGPEEAPPGVAPTLRFKAPTSGETVLDDLVQGTVQVDNQQLDDMVLLRSDGTPTYMLSVVIDDHDMGITHVIRGDDHLTNAFRQIQLFLALGWKPPLYGHIPLIHGPDGAKLSKRHGALAVQAYREMGFLPQALRNYLLRLGWAHGDEEIISTKQAVEWFGLEGIGRSPARFDLAKLNNLNGHYLRRMEDARLVELILPRLAEATGAEPDETGRQRLLAGMTGLKERAKTLVELSANAEFYVNSRPIVLADKAARLLTPAVREALAEIYKRLAELKQWDEEKLESVVRAVAERRETKLGKLAQPLRAALTGSLVSPGIFEIMAVLERQETLSRLADIIGEASAEESPPQQRV